MHEHTTTRGSTAGPVAGAPRSLDRIIVDAQRDHPDRVIELALEPHPGGRPTVRVFAGPLSDPDVRLVVSEWAETIDRCVPKGSRRGVRS